MAKNNNIEMPTLFDTAALQTGSNKIDVVKMNFAGAESMRWQELFAGFDTLHAITFSSGVQFVFRLLEMFQKAEIIFGCEAVMSYSLQEIMAYQSKLLERLRDNMSAAEDNFLNRIDAGEVRLFVARGQLSHEKIYLLSAADGRKRVIMGSANMSYNAFNGKQRENICYMDEEAAYNWYYDVFVSLRENSTDEISHSALAVADLADNIDELPVSGTIKVQRALVIEPVLDNKTDVEFILDTHKLANNLTPMLPKPDKKNGRLKVIPEMIIKLKKTVQAENIRAKEQRSEYPQLLVDVSAGKVLLNDTELNLQPSAEDLAKDIQLFLRYMDGYSRFHGDYESMQYRYFEFANWFFCSPFMAVMRDMAARFDQNRLPYPVFGLVYGQSKAGKTSFLETLLKMMIGQKPKIAAQEFTRSSIEKLKRTVQGAPIIVDDMVMERFRNHAIETIKTDDFGVAEHLINYSAVVISANEDVKAVAPEVIRRTVICRVEAGLTNTEVMRNNVVRTVQKEIGTAFYREYLRRMLEVVPDLLEVMQSDEVESSPDILQVSSQVIVEIMQDYADLPPYIRPLSLENYFSEKVTGKYAIKTIKAAWANSRKSFTVNTRTNELRYDVVVHYDADRLIKELPETLEAHKVGNSVIMNLAEAKEFFGIDFKQSWLPWR